MTRRLSRGILGTFSAHARRFRVHAPLCDGTLWMRAAPLARNLFHPTNVLLITRAARIHTVDFTPLPGRFLLLTPRTRLLDVLRARSQRSAAVVLSAGARRPARAAAILSLIRRVRSPTLRTHKPSSIRSSPARARLDRALHARPRFGELFQSIPLLVITQLTTLALFIARIGHE